MCVCVYVCVSVRARACLYVCMHIYIYIQLELIRPHEEKKTKHLTLPNISANTIILRRP